MRPVLRRNSPIAADFASYRDAFDHLLLRISTGEWQGIKIAQYCSYCERPISTSLAVEHIEPKNGLHAKPMLEGRWTNFLLSCVNCNSKKSTKRVDFSQLFFPDRDNTFLAFEYLENGRIQPEQSLNNNLMQIAKRTIDLFGLDDAIAADVDGVAKDRRTQRLNAWLFALDSLRDFNSAPGNEAVRNSIVKGMLANGFFSIWMKVFKNHPDIRNLFIDSISGTRESGCFDMGANPVSPHPNQDTLINGSKL